jgi:hypothetical protein
LSIQLKNHFEIDSDLSVVSSAAKDIYREIKQDQTQEAISKRDEWQGN